MTREPKSDYTRIRELEAEVKRLRAQNFRMEAHLAADGWRQCAVGQRTTQFCGQLEEAVRQEREACARVCDYCTTENHVYVNGALRCAAAIRARNNERH